ncbi:MAG: AraC family transcriptional regulator [Alistipes sp.]|nr:AraC family transcriptional regulator [Alistipes sp.]
MQEGDKRAFEPYGPCVVLFREGTGRLSTDGGAVAEFSAPQLLLVPHSCYRVEASGPVRAVIFGPDLVRILGEALEIDHTKIRKPSWKPRPVRLDCGGMPLFEFSMGLMDSLIHCRRYAELKFRELVYMLLSALAERNVGEIKCALISRQWFFRVRVEEFAGDGISSRDIAQLVGLSLSGFEKRFRRVFRTSFYRWRQQKRLEAILRDLRSGNKTLSELAAGHGFNSVQHFGFFVKRHTGLSPGRIVRYSPGPSAK